MIYDAEHRRDQVAIVAGGGAGHEPTFAGFTGRGMLTAAVSGDIFASPSAAQICTGIDLAPTDKGVVVVVANYTGDCLNFGLASEKARNAFAGEGKGREVEMVIVGDDVSVGRSKGGLVGRRGLTTVSFVLKAMGAASVEGVDTKSIGKLGRSIVENSVTVGCSLDHCHVPGRPTGAEERGALSQESIEIGMGIHNEPGAKHLDQKPDAEQLIKDFLKLLLDQEDKERAYVKFEKDDESVLVINNLGGLSNLELSALAGDTVRLLASEWNIRPSRVFVGTYITSLNMPGFDITLINSKKVKDASGMELLPLLEAPTDAPLWVGAHDAWKKGSEIKTLESMEDESSKAIQAAQGTGHAVSGSLLEGKAASTGPMNGDSELVKKALQSLCKALIKVEPTLTKYDSVVGDGDAGETLRTCAEAILQAVDANKISFDRTTATVLGVAEVLESNMGGTSGAIYAIFLTGLVQGLIKAEGTADVKTWANASMHALESLHNYTPARPGDRTLVDSLDPFCRTLQKQGESGKSAKEAVGAAVEAAKEGAEKTRDMTARLGRATYIGETKEKVPDPGAWGIWALAEGIYNVL